MALQGTLDTFALPDVLRLLSTTKKSGRLRITGGRGTGSVWVSAGQVCAVEATHAPTAQQPEQALFELLRLQEGAFTFDAEAVPDAPGAPTDVEVLLAAASQTLAEWREIEAVVPSLDAWVTLRRTLGSPEVTLGQDRWTALVAIGGGATVREVGDDLGLEELAVSRSVKELVELGVADVDAEPPADANRPSGAAAPEAAVADRPLLSAEAPAVPAASPAAPAPAPASAPAEADVFVPLDLPHHAPPPTYDGPAASSEHQELALQLSALSPKVAEAVRAAAEATTDEEREAALGDVDDEGDELNRGLLLKFLSSVKS